MFESEIDTVGSKVAIRCQNLRYERRFLRNLRNLRKNLENKNRTFIII